MEYKSNELYHHGILGQKWGKRNGPPYPLKESAHSLKEKREVDKVAKIEKGKKIDKKVLIGIGAVAVGAIAFNMLSASGSDKWVEISKKYGNLKAKGKNPLKKTNEIWRVEREVATHIHGREENGMKLIDQPINLMLDVGRVCEFVSHLVTGRRGLHLVHCEPRRSISHCISNQLVAF